MTPSEIRKEAELMYDKIKKAEDRLREIRSVCPHLNKFEGNYSWRPGAISPAEICSDCGELLKYL